MHAAGRDIARHQLVEARLVDRDLALFQPGDAILVLVDAGDVPAELGKAGGGNEADIARADHANFHGDPLTLTSRKPDILSTVYGQKPQPPEQQRPRRARRRSVALLRKACKPPAKTARKLDPHDRDRHRHVGCSGHGASTLSGPSHD